MGNALQKRTTDRNGKSHKKRTPRHKTSTKIHRGIRRTEGRNIGVFRGSAIRAILFIIYMDDLMEDPAALNIRSKLPTVIIQDRPQGQENQLLWYTIKDQDQEEHTHEMQITRTSKTHATTPEKMNNMTEAQKQIRRNQGVARRRKVQMGRTKRSGEAESETDMAIRSHHILDNAWQIMGDRTSIIATSLRPTQRRSKRDESIPTMRNKAGKHRADGPPRKRRP